MALMVVTPHGAWGGEDPHRQSYCNESGRRDCKGNGNADNPEEGEHYCHPQAECSHYPPFTRSEDSEPPEEHGAHSGKCHDQGCQRHCDSQGCWQHEPDRRP